MSKHYLRVKSKTKTGEAVLEPPSLIYTICSLPIGSFLFCKRKQKTMFDRFGPGIPLYFIYLKTMILYAMVAVCFSIYMMSINRQSKQAIPNFSDTRSLSELLRQGSG